MLSYSQKTEVSVKDKTTKEEVTAVDAKKVERKLEKVTVEEEVIIVRFALGQIFNIVIDTG